MRTRWLLLAALALPMAVAVWAPAAQASFPGLNGKIGFTRVVDSPVEARCIYTATASGASQTVLLPPCDGDQEANPRWSPDGVQIAYQGYGGQIDLVNADGTNLREFFFDSGIGTTGFGWSPDGTEIAVSWFDCFDGLPCGSRIEKVNSSTGTYTTILSTEDFVSGADWSPDGKLIAFTRQFQLHVIRPDGTGLAELAPGSPGDNHSPSWSPNATKIAFVSSRDGNQEIYVMNANGTAQTRLTDNTSFEGSPRWSPDGTKIIFETDRDDDNEIYVMNADGTNQTRLTNTLGADSAPDWQPIPINGYVRPKTATTVRVPLVPAYAQCLSPNRIHGPTLASGSCNPPDLLSDQLKVGGQETNGKPANFTGFVRYSAVTGLSSPPMVDEADVNITVQLTDVIRAGTLADYDGELSAKAFIRRTDRVSSPHPGGAGAATVVEHLQRATVPCAATSDPNVGATCSLATSADALMPGNVTEVKRTVWAVNTVQVEDGGADNDAETLGDNTLFMTQGVFVP